MNGQKEQSFVRPCLALMLESTLGTRTLRCAVAIIIAALFGIDYLYRHFA
jgi:hypothetical protein